MARTQRSYRLDQDTITRLEAWAAEHGTTNTEAVEALLKAALETDEARAQDERTAPAGDAAEIVDTLKANMADLRAQVDTLKAQLEVKDEQLAAQVEQIRGLMDLADHAQQLHAAAVAGYLAPTAQAAPEGDDGHGDGHSGAEDVDGAPEAAEAPAEPQARPATLWERIKRALMG